MTHKRMILAFAVGAAAAFLFAQQATAQIAFSVTQQNGVVTGGGFQVGGFVMPGGTGVRLGVNAGTSQLIGLQNFTFQSGLNNRSARPTTSNTARRRPNTGQFIRSAKQFDRDKDGELNEEELIHVGRAVVAELRRKRGANQQTPSIQHDQLNANPTADAMVKSFVTRCLTFDKDDNKSLNVAETKRMATAFLRSMG